MTNSSPPPGYASDPQLEVLWTEPPGLTGVSASGSQSQPPPLSGAFKVSPQSVWNTEAVMLGSANPVVNAYNALNETVQSAIRDPNLYGQEATVKVSGNRRGLAAPPDYFDDTQLQQAAQQFAAQINPSMTRALRAVADTMQTVGVYIAMLNAAGQMYTTADKNSKLPPLSGKS